MERIDFEEAVGKTIRDSGFFGHGNNFVQVFEDDTYACMEIEHCEDFSDFEQTDFIVDYYLDDAVELGFITESEKQEKQAIWQKEIEDSKERRERKQYEALKAKYG